MIGGRLPGRPAPHVYPGAMGVESSDLQRRTPFAGDGGVADTPGWLTGPAGLTEPTEPTEPAGPVGLTGPTG